ncbi:alpha-amylase family glycosyl hydrolase [Salinibacter grassmerensis]|uniref:alpha-amylase family glycosyl hydrolase n=1 Tax=Salinibacter grassmerensis TaxID=3040353 RepID=UPI0021E91DE9|nr:alpha-amylase family glycosyl hydrolase [Salinibacter grassmerensis]
MSRLWSLLAVGFALLLAPSAAGQVVETTPSPPRTDQPVTLYFNAEAGDAGLEGYDGDIYAHTGISTNQNPEGEWKCVKNNWPTEDAFAGNRKDTRLAPIEGDPNRYKLEIDDIRSYYQETSTQCSLGGDERIQTLNLVFRNGDGSREGKAEGSGDIYVDVFDAGDDPSLRAFVQTPESNPPLYPFITQNSTVDVTVSADTANVQSFSGLQLFVDGTQVASTAEDSLTYSLDTSSPSKSKIRVRAEATADGSMLTDSAETRIIRAPTVEKVARPSDIQGAPGENDGITYNADGSVTLSLYATGKNFVYAIGDFSNWEVDADYFMNRDGDHWWITIPSSALSGQEEYDFQYFVDGEIRTSDPFAHKIRTPQDEGIGGDIYPGLEPYPDDQTENLVSVIRPGQQDPSFAYPDFQPPEREDLVVYELLVRDFVEQSSYQVLADTLDYLDSLGVNAVELMPVANFGGNNSWGYNPNAHLALDKSYGTPDGFRQFVEEAHRRGIAVFMDVVYNHITAQSPLSQLYGANLDNPFLEPQPGEDPSADRGFCDDFFQELNHESPFIKNYIDRANDYWIENFNVDGFRYDLAKCVADDGLPISDQNYSNKIRAGWKDVADEIWADHPETHVILEFFGSTSEENALGGYSGVGNTAGMMTWEPLNRPYSQADMGYQDNSGLSTTYYGNRSGYDQPSNLTYMESHDEQWLMRRKKAFGNERNGYSTRDLKTALNRQKLVGAFFFTVPGPRMMWQFGELGYGWGEDECLKEDGDAEGACDSGDPGRTGPKPVRWEYRDPDTHPDRVRLYKTWSTLLRLRQAHEVFRSAETQVDMQVGSGERIRSIRLTHPSMDALVVGNFGLLQRNADVTFSQTGTWYNVFANEDVRIQDTTKTVPLRPGEFRVYTSEPPAVNPEEGLVPSTVTPPSRLPVDINQSFGTVTDRSNYQLVAVPGSTRVPLSQAAFGTPGDTWRAFHDDGSDSDYLVGYSAEDDRFALGQGRGLWVLSERSFAYEDSVASMSVRNGRTHIDLHNGWNIISNPLGLTVSWDRVRAGNEISAPLHRWENGSFVTADTFRTAATGEAFYFKNETNLDSLSIPYPGSVADRKAAQSALPSEVQSVRKAMTFQLQARRDSAVSAVQLGYKKTGASVQHSAPRTAFSDVQLVATDAKQEGFVTYIQSLASDTASAEQLTFDLRLSTEAEQQVSLRALQLDSFTNRPAILVNRETGKTYEFRSGETVQLTPSTSTTRLRLRIGKGPEDKGDLSPDEVRLRPNYPNPFRSTTTIEYDVPEQSSVRLAVFDVLGRRVATLARGDQGPGRYSVTWAPDDEGQTLASGVYFLRLKAGDKVRSRRVTFVR